MKVAVFFKDVAYTVDDVRIVYIPKYPMMWRLPKQGLVVINSDEELGARFEEAGMSYEIREIPYSRVVNDQLFVAFQTEEAYRPEQVIVAGFGKWPMVFEANDVDDEGRVYAKSDYNFYSPYEWSTFVNDCCTSWHIRGVYHDASVIA
jgi:hypothetical protein